MAARYNNANSSGNQKMDIDGEGTKLNELHEEKFQGPMDEHEEQEDNCEEDSIVYPSPKKVPFVLFDHADSEQCKEALELLKEPVKVMSDSGWWIFNCIKQQQVLALFDTNAEKARRILEIIMDLINTHYVHAETHMRKICQEENVPEREYAVSTNQRVRDFYTKYSNAIKQREYVCLDITLQSLSTLLVNLNALIVGLCMITMQSKSVTMMNALQKSAHIPLLIPFNQDVNLLFQAIQITPNKDYAKQIRADRDNVSNIPLLFISGYVVIICEIAESKGTNKAGKKFKVLNIVNPSANILKQNFNNYIRDMYPSMFPERISPHLFVQLSESLNTASVSCLEPYQNKRYCLVLANIANLFLIERNNRMFPQLQLWCNVKLES